MLVLNLPFKALMCLTLMRPSLVLFLVLWPKLVKDFLKLRRRLALLPFLISCLMWLDLVASLPLIKARILVIILLLHFLSLMLGSRPEERRGGQLGGSACVAAGRGHRRRCDVNRREDAI